MRFGSWAWAKQSGGKLSQLDRWKLTGQAVLAQLNHRKQPVPIAANIDANSILPPDTDICIAAADLLTSVADRFLINHSMRAYIWARVHAGDRPFDDEALFIACALHDLGLTEVYREQRPDGQCFSVVAAAAAENLARRHFWTVKRSQMVADAISLHLNVTVPESAGIEAHLLRFGSGADVAGLRLSNIPTSVQADVFNRYPLHNMHEQLNRTLKHEVSSCPDCRIAHLYRRLGFGRMIERFGHRLATLEPLSPPSVAG